MIATPPLKSTSVWNHHLIIPIRHKETGPTTRMPTPPFSTWLPQFKEGWCCCWELKDQTCPPRLVDSHPRHGQCFHQQRRIQIEFYDKRHDGTLLLVQTLHGLPGDIRIGRFNNFCKVQIQNMFLSRSPDTKHLPCYEIHP